jgi:hypothetical protein
MMPQDTGHWVDRPRQMAYHVIVYFLCRLVLIASSVIGAAQYSAKRFRPGFAVTRFLLRRSRNGAAGPWFCAGILDPLVASQEVQRTPPTCT